LLPPYAYMFIPAGWLTFDRAGLHLLNCTSLAWRTVCFADSGERMAWSVQPRWGLEGALGSGIGFVS